MYNVYYIIYDIVYTIQCPPQKPKT